MIERQTHLESRQNKPSEQAEDDTTHGRRHGKRQSSEAELQRQAGQKRVSQTTRRRRKTLKSWPKLFKKSHVDKHVDLHSTTSRQEVKPEVTEMPEPRHEIQGRILFSVGGSKNYFCLIRANPVRKLGVKFFRDLMCLELNFGSI